MKRLYIISGEHGDLDDYDKKFFTDGLMPGDYLIVGYNSGSPIRLREYVNEMKTWTYMIKHLNSYESVTEDYLLIWRNLEYAMRFSVMWEVFQNYTGLSKNDVKIIGDKKLIGLKEEEE